MAFANGWEVFVHLAYLDESGTDGHCPFVIFGALIIPTGSFSPVEILHTTAIQQILPLDKIDDFKEFHACELYRGTGPFEGMDESKRFTAIQVLLTAVKVQKLAYVYAAADRKSFSLSPFGSGKPLNSAFHMCLLGVEDWATANHPNPPGPPPYEKVKRLDWKDTVLYILDESDDKNQKDQFRNTYRTLRSKHPWVPPHENRLWHAHDHMFLADSKDCVGIQIVDLCNYFLKRRLAGEPDPQNFYEIFREQVICAKPEPEWTTYGTLFKELMVNSENDANAKGKAAQ
jgi:hypothetical protein